MYSVVRRLFSSFMELKILCGLGLTSGNQQIHLSKENSLDILTLYMKHRLYFTKRLVSVHAEETQGNKVE